MLNINRNPALGLIPPYYRPSGSSGLRICFLTVPRDSSGLIIYFLYQTESQNWFFFFNQVEPPKPPYSPSEPDSTPLDSLEEAQGWPRS